MQLHNGDEIADDGNHIHASGRNNQSRRRTFLERSAASVISAGSAAVYGSPTSAGARGLVRFPCKEPLLNTYHLLRAGSSLLEVEDVWSTNPLFLTNREAALSELGEVQVREACRYLKSTGSTPTVVRYSLAASSVDSANIVGEELRVGRDRLVPEFNYMDPRAIGGWDFAALNATEEAVWALDADEAGTYGKGGKPPPNEDGTPAETLADQVVRLTNLMSVLETLYSGDTVLLIFPDGTGPALLSCLIAGIPLNRVHELQFRSGEIRFDVDYNSINALASRQPSQAYYDILDRGRAELKQLRENPDLLRNIKDLKYEEERLEEERRELEAKREEEAKKKELEMQMKKEEAEKRESERQRKKEEAKQKELERQRKREERLQMQNNDGESSLDVGGVGIAAAVLGGAAAVSSMFGGEETDVVVDEGRVPDIDVQLNTTDAAPDTAADVATDEDATTDKLESDEIDQDTDDGDIGDKDDATTPLGTAVEDEMDLLPDSLPGDEEIVASRVPDIEVDFEESWLDTISEILNDSADNNGV